MESHGDPCIFKAFRGIAQANRGSVRSHRENGKRRNGRKAVEKTCCYRRANRASASKNTALALCAILEAFGKLMGAPRGVRMQLPDSTNPQCGGCADGKQPPRRIFKTETEQKQSTEFLLKWCYSKILLDASLRFDIMEHRGVF